jgi:large subunit ribosomal protein L29
MKARKPEDLRELSDKELIAECHSAQETLAQQRFQNELKQLQDTAYLGILRKDIARMKTNLRQRDIKI